jgi:hypothetical protein
VTIERYPGRASEGKQIVRVAPRRAVAYRRPRATCRLATRPRRIRECNFSTQLAAPAVGSLAALVHIVSALTTEAIARMRCGGWAGRVELMI